MSRKTSRIGVIGVGVMGRALLEGLSKSSKFTRDALWGYVREEKKAKQLGAELGVSVLGGNENSVLKSDVILIAVKPGQAETVCSWLKKSGLKPDTLVISIMAGVTTAMLEGWLKSKNPVVRAMPNTAAVIGDSMTVITGGLYAKLEHLEQATEIFSSIGNCVHLGEQHFDAVTGLCGSGPAYLYLIMEALADGGVKVGLPRKEALEMIAQTVLGSANMVLKTRRHPAALRDEVTTPAGCTISGLLIMEDGKIRSVLARAVEEATRIAGGLGQGKKS